MANGAKNNESRYKERTKAQEREYKKQMKGKKSVYHKCRVKLKPDKTNCYGAGGRGKCKAANKVDCSEWQTKKIEVNKCQLLI